MENNIIEKYSNVVKSLARRFSNDIEIQKDLVQEGYIGLLTAEKKYDETIGVNFLTYAFPCIKNNMLLYLRNYQKNKLCKLSENEISVNDDLDNICFDSIESLIDECSPECQEIISLMVDKGFSIREIADMKGYSKSKVSYILSKEKDKLYKKIKKM